MTTNKKYAAMLDILRNKKKLDISLLSNDPSCLVEEWLESGCLALDRILGGGYPVGRITEIYGDTSSGKSLLAAQVAAIAQEDGCIVALADSESAVSLPIMKAVGVDIDNILYSSPDTVEEVFEQFDAAIETKQKLFPDDILLIIWDSIAATSSKDELEKDYGEMGYPSQARIISQSLRKMTRKISKMRVCAIFLNQVRKNIGVKFGDPDATFGGKAVSFHSSVRLHLKVNGKIKEVDELGKKRIVGLNTTATVVKNKVAYPFQEATLPIFFGHGVDDALSAYWWLENNGYFEELSKQTKLLELPSGDVKFSRNKWNDVFDKHFDEIADIFDEDLEEQNESYGDNLEIEDE